MDFNFEKKSVRYAEGRDKLSLLAGDARRAISPILIEHRGKEYIGYLYTDAVREWLRILAKRIPADRRQKLFVKAHGVLEDVPCGKILELAERLPDPAKLGAYVLVRDNASGYGLDLQREGHRDLLLRYLLVDKNIPLMHLLKEKKSERDESGFVSLVQSYAKAVGRLYALGYKTRHLKADDAVVLPSDHTEVRFVDIFRNIVPLDERAPNQITSDYAELEDMLPLMLLGPITLGIKVDDRTRGLCWDAVSQGFDAGYTEFGGKPQG